MAIAVQTLAALSLTLLVGGCGFFRTTEEQPVEISAATAASQPALGCPWVDSERYHVPVRLAGTSGMAPAQPVPFVPGCAIVRFRVAADGSVYKAQLRSALPLNDGPSALAAVQAMRFQAAARPETVFVIRLGMQRDSAGHTTIAAETRPGGTFFGGQS